jgi:hypothetical protein
MRWDTTLRDRIIILEDKDGDGKHDGRSVFWEGGSYLTSIENGYGGVWMLHNGTLSFIAGPKRRRHPDGEPQVLLDGFNTKTIGHNIVNGLRWGPDGWLYGRHGITDTSAVGAPGTRSTSARSSTAPSGATIPRARSSKPSPTAAPTPGGTIGTPRASCS